MDAPAPPPSAANGGGPAAIAASVSTKASGDLIFLPSDSHGTPGTLNGQIRKQLRLPELPDARALAKGYAIQRTPERLICYVVTVSSDSAEVALERNLAAALADPELARARSYWLPLMGTGTAKLSHEASARILLDQLVRHPPIRDGRATAKIAMPNGMPAEVRNRINTAVAIAVSQLSAPPRGAGNDASAKAALPPSPPPSNPADAYQLPRTAAVTALLELASLLAPLPEPKRTQVSTSLVFFALAESSSAAAAPALANDGAAETFAAAVQQLGRAHYAVSWRDYFKHDRKPDPLLDPPSELLPPTPNVAAVLAAAKTLAGPGDEPVAIDHVVTALLDQRRGRMRKILAAMQIEATKLLEEYRDARVGRVATRFQNDVAGSDDRLDYARYAEAIHKFLIDRQTESPLSVSIQAPWGGGKSTLMHQLRERLDPKKLRERYKKANLLSDAKRLTLGALGDLLDKREGIAIDSGETADPSRRWTIWFNAWKYETTDQLWAGLVDAIVSQTAQRLSPVEREKFLLKLQLARIDDGIIRKRVHDRVASLFWGKSKALVLGGAAAVASLFALGAARPALPDLAQQLIGLGSANGYVGALVVQAALSLLLIGKYLFVKEKTKTEPAKFSLADILKVPDYDKGVGELHHAHADLRKVLEVVPQKAADGSAAPLVIFIDDLDRCSPGKVASVVEGVSMILATDEYRCMFVIGMDPQMVAAALEKAHEDVRKKLPRYERQVPLGWRFMDKFVQLPFTLPPSDADAFNRYVAWLAGEPEAPVAPPPAPVIVPPIPADDPPDIPDGEDGPIPAPTPSLAASSDSQSDAASERNPDVEAFVESRDVGAIIRRIADFSVGNPREMKRMVNLARFYLTLKAARAKNQTAWQPPSAEQYARWIALTLRWPDMLRWLQWGADEAHWPPETLGTALTVRRLRTLEAQADKAATPQAWRIALAEQLGLPAESNDSGWADDARLFEFFKTESGLTPGKRLSDAAVRGFW